jgi:hypothetical protein
MRKIAPVMDDPHRCERLAMMQAWRRLRRSVALRRPISLPNLIRLYHRLSTDLRPASHRDPSYTHLEVALRRAYFRRQPFRSMPPPPRVG